MLGFPSLRLLPMPFFMGWGFFLPPALQHLKTDSGTPFHGAGGGVYMGVGTAGCVQLLAPLGASIFLLS